MRAASASRFERLQLLLVRCWCTCPRGMVASYLRTHACRLIIAPRVAAGHPGSRGYALRPNTDPPGPYGLGAATESEELRAPGSAVGREHRVRSRKAAPPRLLDEPGTRKLGEREAAEVGRAERGDVEPYVWPSARALGEATLERPRARIPRAKGVGSLECHTPVRRVTTRRESGADVHEPDPETGLDTEIQAVETRDHVHERMVHGKEPGQDLVDPVDAEEESPDLPHSRDISPDRLRDAKAPRPVAVLLTLGDPVERIRGRTAVELEEGVVDRSGARRSSFRVVLQPSHLPPVARPGEETGCRPSHPLVDPRKDARRLVLLDEAHCSRARWSICSQRSPGARQPDLVPQ